MTLPDTTALKALAEAATPGPWQRSGVRQKISEDCIMVGPDGLQILAIPYGWHPKDHAGAFKDAAYIAAANPQTVLTLLASVETLTADLERVTAERDDAQRHDARTMDASELRIALPSNELERFQAFVTRAKGAEDRATAAEADAARLRRLLDEREDIAITATADELASIIERHDQFDCQPETTHRRAAKAIADDILVVMRRTAALATQGGGS